MIFRQAFTGDIPQIQFIRHAVRENRLSDPSLVPDKDVEDYICRRGMGWVCELDKTIIGFAIADLQDHSVWALFVHPDHEKKGIGKKLQQTMLNWYFSKTPETIWLSTAPGTRAETFYHKTGWLEKGVTGKGETRFEMSLDDWRNYFGKLTIKQELALVAVVVRDYDEAIRFYTEKLGFILEEDTVLSPVKRWVRVRPPGNGSGAILLAKAANEIQESSIGNQSGGRVFLFLHTNDFKRDYKKMVEKGVEFTREPQKEAYGTVAVFKDLYGNLWDLIEPAH